MLTATEILKTFATALAVPLILVIGVFLDESRHAPNIPEDVPID